MSFFTGRVTFIKMASQLPTHWYVECDLCLSPVSFYCQRCGVKLCDPCVTVHLRIKCKAGHNIVDYASKEEVDDACFCVSHPESKCSAYCKTCDVPICILCATIKHKSHDVSELQDKVRELLERITRKNNVLQSFRQELETLLDHTSNVLYSLPSFYQRRKNEVTKHGKELIKLIRESVQKLNQELEDLKSKNEVLLKIQKEEFEEMIGYFNEINRKSMKLQKSSNVTEMKNFISVIESQITAKSFKQYTLPKFHGCKIDKTYIESYFGYIEKIQENELSVLRKKAIATSDISLKERPRVHSVIDTGLPGRLYTMAIINDMEIWIGGRSKQLKLFDLHGKIQRTLNVPCTKLYICMHESQVVFSDTTNKAIQQISQDNAVVTLFKTGNWKPYGITDTTFGQLLVCLRKDDQSKVVRYSGIYSVLQEIQYNSQCQPLYEAAWYITENINGDIIVSDYKKDAIVAVDRLGIFRYIYSGTNNDLDVGSVANDSKGLVFVADCKGDKIHILDGDGNFLQYIDFQRIKKSLRNVYLSSR